jgi:hypothetical protein
MKDKPIKWGYKNWCLCDESGYVYNIETYCGVDIDENGKNIRHIGIGKHVVLDLMTPYYNLGHVVTTDNYFTSVDLAEELLELKTYLVGQIKSNSKHLPKEWIKNSSKAVSKSKGEFKFTFSNKNIGLFIWY